jgi:hypothetical protein
MNVELIKDLIKKKGGNCVNVSEDSLGDLISFVENSDIKDYLMFCLTEEGFTASGLAIMNLETIQDETIADVSPGGFIKPFGYLVVATSVGGNAVCLDKNSSSVYWADHSYFFDDLISYEDKETGEWHDLPVNPENIKKALIYLDGNIEKFLKNLFEDKLEAKLDELD